MQVGTSWKQGAPHGPFDAVVIGSGIGGLACAAALARYGKSRVLVLERHYRIGGYTHTFTRPGYEWDVGVHYLGQLGEKGAMKAVFDRLTDGSVRWAPLPDVYDRVFMGDRAYDFVTGRERFIEKLSSYFPREADAIRKYVGLCREVSSASRTYFLEKALPRWASAATGGLLSRTFARAASRTTIEVLRELTQDEELIGVLTAQYGDYGLPPARSSFAIHALLVTHYLQGAYYPVGGASVIARAFAPVIEEAGGVLCHSAEVASVLVEGDRAVGVKMASGEEVRAKTVVSDAGAANTFNRLVPAPHVPQSLRAALGTVTASSSYLCLYLGFEQTDAELGLTGTNLWLYPDHRHDVNTARFEADPDAPLPLVYASFPSAKDPSWSARYPNRATIDLITPFSWSWVERWKDAPWRRRGEAYEALKLRFGDRMLEALYARLPQLRGKVAFRELSTPLSVERFAGHPRGELYGLDHSPARYRVPLRAKTPLAGLYLTGADLVSAGVGGALMGGVMCAGSLLGIGAVASMTARS